MDMEKEYNKSQKKLVNYYSAVVRSDFFVNEFIELRKKIGIELGKPETFKSYATFSGKWGGPGYYALKCYRQICERFDLRFWVWFPLFEEYLRTSKVRNYDNVLNSDLIYVEDVIFQNEIPAEYRDDFQEQYDLSYPVSLRISPFVSQGDIEDFVKRYYKETIKPLQVKYRNKKLKIGRVREHKNRIRDDFIYKNKHLSLKEISGLVKDKFNKDLDEGHIGKIISLERSRRKEL